jgi:proliferating cell nuclear antigen PCNA
MKESINLSFDTTMFHSIINTKSEGQSLSIEYNPKKFQLLINFISENDKDKSEFTKFFTLPLADYDYEEMSVPHVEYDAEFSLSSKKITDILNQLENFGEDISVKCGEDCIDLTSTGVSGEMRVNIPSDDLSGYSIIEDGEIDLTYSLTYINKLCITNKLTQDIEFYISNERPMKIAYNLGGESYIVFHIAPKIV